MDTKSGREQMNALFEEVSHYFSLLSEPTRLKILHALCNGERAVGDIVVQSESTQANISRQLNMLYRYGILARRKEGTQVYYRIKDQSTIDLCRDVCGKLGKDLEDRRLMDDGTIAQFMASGDKR
ncbi:metalloregulator ArsR/SmtB family transcription factor [Noviherbaspirillum sp.]|uniref:ArsR/SmtB family transcription factor n=1 Tax=Noviherbaspirillum sp. TaxID=1926288 RepID=UPI002B483532|nr:metalloregulator ArsR/SmtB family transcription factor [Noviherbaspirillum sp.]HJV79924.1 metalloregulator ArsR/SmtB family transcription factor [Noviherbaspirillum sp.]